MQQLRNNFALITFQFKFSVRRLCFTKDQRRIDTIACIVHNLLTLCDLKWYIHFISNIFLHFSLISDRCRLFYHLQLLVDPTDVIMKLVLNISLSYKHILFPYNKYISGKSLTTLSVPSSLCVPSLFLESIKIFRD